MEMSNGRFVQIARIMNFGEMRRRLGRGCREVKVADKSVNFSSLVCCARVFQEEIKKNDKK